MKHILFGGILLATLPFTVSAATLSESFEASSFPESWTVNTAKGCTKGIWSIESYGSVGDFTASRIAVPEDAGEKFAMSTTGGISTMSKVCPDSWLISPAVAVPDNACLKFYYAFNLTYNSNVNLTDEQKAKFSVLVSTTGTDAADFTDELFFDVGEGLGSWRHVCLDLSKYSGKDIYIAFRNYNTELHETASSMVTQRLYLDNVIVDESPAYDILLTSASDFTSGTVTDQPLSVAVKNYGHDIESFQVAYSIDGGKAVTETVNAALRQGETYEYDFQQNIKFAAGNHSIAITATTDNDRFDENGTLTKTAIIAAQAALPFTLSSNAKAATELISTLSGTQRKPIGWTYFEEYYKCWIYTEANSPAYLYTATSFHFTPGTYTAEIGYTSTSTTAQLDLYAFNTVGDYGTPLASKALSQQIEKVTNETITFQIETEGDYLIGLSVSGTSKNEQVTLPSLTIAKAAEAPDVVVKEILSPNGSVIGGNYSVSATISNDGGSDAADVQVSFALGTSTGSGVISSIKSGETITYTFDDKVVVPETAGDYTLTVAATVAGDSNESNNSATTTISAYSPLALPWRDSFEDDDATAKWTVANPDNNMTYWGISDEYSWDGDNVMLLNSFSAETQNDWLISPALNFTSTDKARIAFYFGNLNDSSASGTISIYLAQSADPEAIKSDGKLIKSFKDKAANLSYVSAPFSAEPGTYYVAIHVDGGQEAVYVDDVRVDFDNEVYVSNITCTAAEASYEVEDAEITITVVNGGVSDLSDVKVQYTVNADEVVDEADETIASLPAGASIDYTFSKKVNINKQGTYTIAGIATSADDTDDRNNTATTPEFHILATKTAPYLADFEEDDDEYAVMLGGKWEISTLATYAGYNSLYMAGKASDEENGDWAILHKLYLEPGEYDFSFFWRTTPGGYTDSYKKSISLYLGTAPDPSKMTALLYNGDDLLNTSYYAAKELSRITIDAAGYYYVGVQNRSTTVSGYIALDNISIKRPDEGLTVGAEADAYRSDIENNDGEWYHYHPTSSISQWTKTSDEDGTYFGVSEYLDWSGVLKTTSYLEAPALRLNENDTYQISVEYSINPFLSSNTIGEGNSLGLYASTIDNPSEFALIKEFTTREAKVEEQIEFTATTTGAYYFSLRPSTVDEVKYRLYSFTVEDISDAGVSTVTTDSALSVNGRQITANGTIAVYNLQGALIARATKAVTLPAGVYIVSTSNQTYKLRLR